MLKLTRLTGELVLFHAQLVSQLGKNLISCAFCGRWGLLLSACSVFQDGSSGFTPQGGGDADGDSERVTVTVTMTMTRWLAFTAKVCFSVFITT